MNIAFVGCGFVSGYYYDTLKLHPELKLLGATDINTGRAASFANRSSTQHYKTLDEILSDDRVDIVVNLTNPASHYEVSKACLEAGKHVYSEKPLAMEFSQAQELVDLAKRRDLYISAAPCSLLNEAAQTAWKALRANKVGQVRVVYAEMDDGMVHRRPYKRWKSPAGIPWPYKDEFEVGCTIEHAGYIVTWLTAFFGPAETVTAFSSCLIPDKETDVPLEMQSPDFSVACIRFKSGVVARLTCSILAPSDHSIKFIGDDGILYVEHCWRDRSPVYIRRDITIRSKTILNPWKERCQLVGKSNPKVPKQGEQNRNFCRGIAELAIAIKEQRDSRLSDDYCLHVCEIVLAIHNALEKNCTYELSTGFEPIEPMPYAIEK